jgi:hypothetical protein
MSRGTRASVARRVDIVYKLILDGLDRREILSEVAKHHKSWKCAPSSVDRYIAKAKQLLSESGERDRDLEWSRTLMRLHDLYRTCRQRNDERTALAVVKEISELCGLKAPLEINLNDARRQLVDLMVEEVMREAENATAGAGQAD